MIDISALVFPVWLFLVFWLWLSAALGITTKKERLCIVVLIYVIAVVVSIQSFLEAKHVYSHLIWSGFIFLNVRGLIDVYKRWKNTDDDDDWKHRRKSWAKSHLPKPITKTIPQPI